MTEMRPRVSVLVPTYQRAGLLAVTLATLLGQTFDEPYEVIVMDDGSTDATADTVRAFPCVRYVSLPHRGLAATINAGICLARGEYVMLANDHDLYAPETLAALAEGLDAHPSAALAVPDVVLVTPDAMREVATYAFPYGSLVPGARFLAEQLLPGIGSIAPHNMWRACILRGEGIDEADAAANDFELWLRLASRGDVVHVPRTLVRARDRDPDSSFYFRNHEVVAHALRWKRAYLHRVPDPARQAAIEQSWRPRVDRSAAYALWRCLEAGHAEARPLIADLARREGTRAGGAAIVALCHLPPVVAGAALRGVRAAHRRGGWR